MIETKTYDTLIVHNNYDPTRTTSLRNTFAREMRKRFDEVSMAIIKAIVKEDVFGYNRDKLKVMQLSTPGNEAFAFARDQEKIEAFLIWLRELVDAGVLEQRTFERVGDAIEGVWTNFYINDAYKRGVIRARYELIKAGYTVPALAETGGIAASMMLPVHSDRVGMLFTRVFSDLKGVTDAMGNQIGRVLADGIMKGESPRVMARKLKAVIDGKKAGELGITDTLGRYIPAKRRAEMIARTETIRAHHLATIQEYRNWGLYDIKVKAEWSSAHDGRVCEYCLSMDGKVFTLDEIEPMIPAHPNCRCIALPVIVE